MKVASYTSLYTEHSNSDNRNPHRSRPPLQLYIFHRCTITTTLSVTNQPVLALLPPITLLIRAAIVSLPAHVIKLLVAVVLRHPLSRRALARDPDVSKIVLGTAATTLARERARDDLERVFWSVNALLVRL